MIGIDTLTGPTSRVAPTVSKDAIVKVILENAYLDDEEKVRGCRLAEEAGAHFVKTSTGFAPNGAVIEDLRLMRATVSPPVQVKAAGGVPTLAPPRSGHAHFRLRPPGTSSRCARRIRLPAVGQ
jgi:deoxyribose-phosphate aldolase